MSGISAVRTISFTGNDTAFKGKTEEERKETAKKVVEGGGAGALVAKGASARARKSGLAMFTDGKNLSNISKETGDAISAAKNLKDAAKLAKAPINKSKSLFALCKKNGKRLTDDILKWAERMKKSKFLKPILESKLFMKFAGAVGVTFGFVTLASGLTDIAAATTDIYQSKFAVND